jgi:transposase InsO family protein
MIDYFKVPLHGHRKYVELRTEFDGKPIYALHDTGAGVSLLSARIYNIMKSDGVPMEPVTPKELATMGLQNASGDSMHIIGCLRINVIIGKNRRAMNIPFAVASKMPQDAIIGINVLQSDQRIITTPRHEVPEYAICGNVQEKKCYDASSVKFQEGSCYTTTTNTLKPRESRPIKIRPELDNGSALKPGTEYVASCENGAFAVLAGFDGLSYIYASNDTDTEIVLEKNTRMGSVEVISSDTPGRFTMRFTDACQTQKRKGVMSGVDYVGPIRRVSPAMKQRINIHVTKTVSDHGMHARMVELLCKYHDVFSVDKYDIGKSTLLQHTIDMKEGESGPIFTKQFPIPLEHYDVIEKNLRQWLQLGIVAPARSKFNSPIFCVPKKEGQGWRVVLDYRKINSSSKLDNYSIRCIDEYLLEIGKAGSTIFSSLDLTSGFWQMPLHPDSREYTAFTFPGHGQFQWTRGAMGLMGCPASFSRLMEMVMEGLPNTLTYIDDILLHSKTWACHMVHLEEALKRLRKHGLKLNLEKCTFGSTTVQYLGHTLTPEGCTPGEVKAKEAMKLVAPSDKVGVRKLCGLMNYFRAYIKDFASMAKPLYALTSNTCEWKGGKLPDKALQAFNKLKEALASRVKRAYPTKTGTFHLYTDGSPGDATHPGGLGAHLMQEDINGREKTIAFYSRQLLPHERNYSAFLIEVAAAKNAMDHFRQLLRGRRFLLHTDHQPLVRLNKTSEKTLNVLRDFIADFSSEIVYVKGSENIVADFFSRYSSSMGQDDSLEAAAINAASSTPMMVPAVDLDPETLKDDQHRDIHLSQLIRTLEEGAKPKLPKGIEAFGMRNDILCVKRRPQKRIMEQEKEWIPAIPATRVEEIIYAAHNSAIGGHKGCAAVLATLMRSFWWPYMAASVTDQLNKCPTCNTTSNKMAPGKIWLQPLKQPSRPGERVHMDLFGPLKSKSETKKKYIMVMTDAFSKLVALAVLPQKTPHHTARALMDKWITYYGVPGTIVSDNGKEFANETIAALLKIMGTEHKMTSPYHPQANAQAETFNKEIIRYMSGMVHDAQSTTDNWESFLSQLQLSHNQAVHSSTNQAPFQTLMGFTPPNPMWMEADYTDTLPTKMDASIKDRLLPLSDSRKKVHLETRRNNERTRLVYERKHNEKARPAETFAPDEKVWCKIMAPNDRNKKFGRRWREATIIERTSEMSYMVRMDTGRHKGRRFNVSHLKKRVQLYPSSESSDDTSSSDDERYEKVPNDERYEKVPNDERYEKVPNDERYETVPEAEKETSSPRQRGTLSPQTSPDIRIDDKDDPNDGPGTRTRSRMKKKSIDKISHGVNTIDMCQRGVCNISPTELNKLILSGALTLRNACPQMFAQLMTQHLRMPIIHVPAPAAAPRPAEPIRPDQDEGMEENQPGSSIASRTKRMVSKTNRAARRALAKVGKKVGKAAQRMFSPSPPKAPGIKSRELQNLKPHNTPGKQESKWKGPFGRGFRSSKKGLAEAGSYVTPESEPRASIKSRFFNNSKFKHGNSVVHEIKVAGLSINAGAPPRRRTDVPREFVDTANRRAVTAPPPFSTTATQRRHQNGRSDAPDLRQARQNQLELSRRGGKTSKGQQINGAGEKTRAAVSGGRASSQKPIKQAFFNAASSLVIRSSPDHHLPTIHQEATSSSPDNQGWPRKGGSSTPKLLETGRSLRPFSGPKAGVVSSVQQLPLPMHSNRRRSEPFSGLGTLAGQGPSAPLQRQPVRTRSSKTPPRRRPPAPEARNPGLPRQRYQDDLQRGPRSGRRPGTTYSSVLQLHAGASPERTPCPTTTSTGTTPRLDHPSGASRAGDALSSRPCPGRWATSASSVATSPTWRRPATRRTSTGPATTCTSSSKGTKARSPPMPRSGTSSSWTSGSAGWRPASTGRPGGGTTHTTGLPTSPRTVIMRH